MDLVGRTSPGVGPGTFTVACRKGCLGSFSAGIAAVATLGLRSTSEHIRLPLPETYATVSSSLALPRGGAGLMPKGCQLDASPRSTGPPALTGLAPCNLSPPRPTFTSRRHSPSDVLRSETVALAWFSPERWCSPCNVEHFARATIPARNPLCPVLKVQLLEGILRSWSLGKRTYVRADVRMDSPMFWAAVDALPPGTSHARGASRRRVGRNHIRAI